MNRESENIWFFLFKKIIFHKNKKSSIIAKQEGELEICITRDDNGRVWDGSVLF